MTMRKNLMEMVRGDFELKVTLVKNKEKECLG